jgi:1,2-diacylglycerol 3-alpha-glucosyltransferase
MRILIASDTYYPHVNGASYFTQRLAAALAERGHEVGVIAPSLTIHNDTIMRGNVHMFGVHSFPVLIVPKFRFVLPWIINRRIAQVMNDFKPDIVHIQMHFPVSRAVLNAARRENIPVVATNHFMPDNLTHYLHLPRRVTEKIHEWAWKDAARTYRKTRGVSAPTRTAGIMLEPWLKGEVITISNGIHLTRFNPRNDPAPARREYNLPDMPTLLFVGRLDREKNVDLVLRAVQQALKDADFHFVAAGHGAEGASLKKLAHKLGISEKVTFTGFVPDELLPSLYATADCFVIAGIAELQCIVAMEAMATGLPVLGARAVALPELIHDGENGYLFEPCDKDELAARIVELFNDPILRKRMGTKSRELIASHDIDLVMERFEEFYRTAMLAPAAM